MDINCFWTVLGPSCVFIQDEVLLDIAHAMKTYHVPFWIHLIRPLVSRMHIC